MVKRGLEEDIDVFLFCGDAFRTTRPTPTQQKVFAQCLKPLADAGVPMVMLSGNHDHPVSYGKATSIDIFGYLTGDVHVFRKPTAARIQTRRGPLQLLAMPWPVRSVLLAGAEYKRMTPEALCEAIEQKYHAFVKKEAARFDPALPTVLAGHFSVTGSLKGGSEASTLMLQEPVLSPVQLAVPPIDYVALGHIHHHQNCATDADAVPVVYSSSIERVTFRERDSRKGFVLVTIARQGASKKTSYRFIETPARRFIALDLDLKSEADPTEAVLKAIEREKVAGSIIRVRMKITESQWSTIEVSRIRHALKPAFAIAAIDRIIDSDTRKHVTSVHREASLKEALTSYIAQRNDLKELEDALIEKALALDAGLDQGPLAASASAS